MDSNLSAVGSPRWGGLWCRWLRGCVHAFACITFVLTWQCWSIEDTHAATGQFQPKWKALAVGASRVAYAPVDNWSDIAVGKQEATGAFNIDMLKGEKWVTNDDTVAGILGVSSSQTGNVLQKYADKPPIVIARYFLEKAELRIQAFRVIRSPDQTVRMQVADWTPWHGALFEQGRYFLNAAELSNPSMLGNDPLGRFGNPTLLAQSPNSSTNHTSRTDPTFYGISWAAAQVSIGLAMAHFRSNIGFVSMPKLRLDQKVETSGGILRKTVTITTTGYATPIWYVATPPSGQPYSQSASICAVKTGSGSNCDDVAHMVPSGIGLQLWEGGNIPKFEDLLYTNVVSKSSWTILAFVLVAAVLAFAGGFALGTLLTGSAGWTAAGVMAGASGGIGGASIGAIAGATAGLAYAVGSTVLNHGGPLTQPQASMLGSTGWGVVSVDDATSEHVVALQSAVESRTTQTGIQGGLTGDVQMLQGSCALTSARSVCIQQGNGAGVAQRVDDPRPSNSVTLLAERERACAGAGYTGANLQRCSSGALLTPQEALAAQSGNYLVDVGYLPPVDPKKNTAAALYYQGAAPPR